ncbi:hypothetical protein [Stappia sp.]|uniref:hypothetical protein n=1 Tax=Stappia sp. TaxID=1870903 RepID=UPI003A9909FC
MSELPRHPEAFPQTNEPLRIAVRRLRWFTTAFRRHVEAFGADIGCRFEIDEAKLAGIFVRWLRTVERQKPSDKSAREDYFDFAAGIMLRELTADMPIRALAAPTKAAPDSAAAFWPEGYVSTLFCLSVHAAAARQEFRHAPEPSAAIDDLRHWWSFRENAAKNASFSVGFLQMLLGHQPNWAMPDVFRARLEREVAERG